MSTNLHCRVETRGSVALVVLDVAERTQNVLDVAVIEDLVHALTDAANLPFARAVVLKSGKPAGFCAGADVNGIAAIRSAEEGARVSRIAQEAFAKIERLSKPVVAAIHGPCLGGGLELALACHGIIAAHTPATKIGLPEVKLGIVPGFGGTQRLPRRIRLTKALDLILTGRTLVARQAQAAGLVDDVVCPYFLEQEACAYALELADGKRPRNEKRRRGLLVAIERFAPVRRFVLDKARARVVRETRGVYPAPLAAIELIGKAFETDRAAGFAAEAEAIGRLLAGPVAHHLVGLFQTTEALRKAPGPSEWKLKDARVGVVGAGVMGSGIALALLRGGARVRLIEKQKEALVKGAAAIARDVEADRSRGKLSVADARALLDRLELSLEMNGLARASLAIEAVVERLDVKQEVFRRLEKECGPDRLLASNTSSLPVAAIAAALEHRARVAGLHFFNPVARMPLVEVVAPSEAHPETVRFAATVAREIGKTPLVVTDTPGFLVNRVLAPYLAEALLLVEEGAAPLAIDDWYRNLGFPMGPLRVLDTVGLDVANEVARTLRPFLGERAASPRVGEVLAAMGHLGDKTGGGIYRRGRFGRREPAPWLGEALTKARAERSAGGAAPSTPSVPSGAPDFERPFVLLLAESARAFADRVVAETRFVDAALVLGAGFPAALGGPLAEIARRGPDAFLARMRDLAARCGPRFSPDAALEHALRA